MNVLPEPDYRTCTHIRTRLQDGDGLVGIGRLNDFEARPAIIAATKNPSSTSKITGLKASPTNPSTLPSGLTTIRSVPAPADLPDYPSLQLDADDVGLALASISGLPEGFIEVPLLPLPAGLFGLRLLFEGLRLVSDGVGPLDMFSLGFVQGRLGLRDGLLSSFALLLPGRLLLCLLALAALAFPFVRLRGFSVRPHIVAPACLALRRGDFGATVFD